MPYNKTFRERFLTVMLTVYGYIVKTAIAGVLGVSFLLVLAQTSFCPLNLKLVIDFTFEKTTQSLRSYQKYFPMPKEVHIEEEK
ncbi:hypothetical protein Dip518_001029 [Parelusimicrobium proximum]|uniref:hypothetical protein n=1 Tax=Parelusimicrobium proximum TaxID=3228953 RepID=UPI003D16C3F2